MLLGLKLMPSLRIIALPLAKARPSALLVSRPLVYYHFNLAPPGAAERNKSWTNRMLNKLTTVAADAWANFGKAPEGSWKARLRLYQHGERLVDRIDFEELTLKGVDPSLAPSLRNRGVAGKPLEGLSGSDQKSEERPPVIRLIYPPSLYSSLSTPLSDESVHPSLSHLRVLLDSRGPRHRRGFYLWMMITPLTFPLTIIPVIPNIPFFFCAWRSWSHYKAYKSSQYLSSLIDQGFVHPEPNQELDEVYRLFSPSAPNANSALSNCCEVPSSDKRGKPENASDCNLKSISSLTADSNTGPVPHHLLLSRGAVPRILELFSLPDSAAADMYRAMEQVRVRLQAEPQY
ncbi:mitochondrial K+-H+ exchange-related-domain-containing protein [Pisolithus orientalis]|uniref:mitochondrial K+-H+ exchange-related-domain-containing protein n=1 Tax=Pisolithus orientalis TaxID=936130 RepID=UPI002224E968|nr:mitochondrial K+-H+ exchange-related-domain-containing protein [Pisolithus orientalis]KAI6030900.1 mitochondrial K+-H+ exchange-related-domain-containing protein [Pisolithus orientalis]